MTCRADSVLVDELGYAWTLSHNWVVNFPWVEDITRFYGDFRLDTHPPTPLLLGTCTKRHPWPSYPPTQDGIYSL